MARDPGAHLCNPANSQAPPNLKEREHRTLFLAGKKNGFSSSQAAAKLFSLKTSLESSGLSGSPLQLLHTMENKDSMEVDDKSLVDVGLAGMGGDGVSSFVVGGNSNKKSLSAAAAGGAVSTVTSKATTGAATATAAAAPIQVETPSTAGTEQQDQDDTGEESSSDEAAPVTGGAAAALLAKGSVVASTPRQGGGVDAGALGSIILSKSAMESVAEEIRRQASSEGYR